MKNWLTILIVISFCLNGIAKATPIDVAGDSTVKVLVLIPYDQIANAGVSPDTRSILESALAGKSPIKVIPFPFKELIGVPYQMVFDKKYCKAITDKVQCDVVIMTQIITDNERKPGTWPWAYKVRLYNVGTGKQINSIHGENLEFADFPENIKGKIDKLIKDIESSF